MRNNIKIAVFLIAWLLINCIQGRLMGLHEDEAYYWLYSRFPAWGYFDHPPMIAFFIRTGYFILQSPLGVRLLTILASAATAWFAWKTIEPYAKNAGLFILVYLSFLLFHLYGFIATADSALLFFSVLLLYGYRNYLLHDNWKWSLFMALVTAGLLYSKYHGILLLFFILLSNPMILKRRSAWAIVLLSTALYLPHIWWQTVHGYPSLQYHLFDRSAGPYKWSFTGEFILMQVLITAPLAGWYFFYAGSRVQAMDPFLRGLKFSFYGIFIFFFITTFKGRVEAHWTLTGSLVLCMLCCVYFARKPVKRWQHVLLLANVALTILGRIFFISPLPSATLRKMTGIIGADHVWVQQLKTLAGDSYVVFNKGFQEASKYDFYTGSTKGFSYNSRYYRKNQFDLWPIEDSLRGKKCYYVTYYPHREASEIPSFLFCGPKSPQDSFLIGERMFYGRWVDSVRLYQKAVFTTGSSFRSKPGEAISIPVTIQNPYDDPLNFGNKGATWKCFVEYAFCQKGDVMEVHGIDASLIPLIPPHEKIETTIKITAPKRPGDYQLFFSTRTDPFPGARNSRMIRFTVKD